MSPRGDRALAGVELVVIVAVAVLQPSSVAIVLVAAAALSAAIREQPLFSHGDHAAPPLVSLGVGAAVGAIALAAALVVGGPLWETLMGREVVWADAAVGPGSAFILILVALSRAAQAAALEIAMRGWLWARATGLAPKLPAAAVMAGIALVEAVVVPGDVANRAGVFVAALGYGALRLASGRVSAPVAARLVFEIGAVVATAA